MKDKAILLVYKLITTVPKLSLRCVLVLIDTK